MSYPGITESNTAAALRDMAAALAMPPPPKRRQQQLKNLRNTQNDEENSHSYEEHDKKRQKSSVTPSTATGELRPILNRPRCRKENVGVTGRPEGRGGRGHKVKGGPLCHTDAHRREGVLGAGSKPRHFPPIGRFKPPPPPLRAPLTQIRNQNNQKVTQNTQNTHFAKDKHKNAVKSTVTYVENHKGELEIIKYKNRKRGSVVAFDRDLEVQGEVHNQLGQQHQEQDQQLSVEGHAEQDDNQYHELRRVASKKRREYAKELYYLFKRDLRDWEEQEEIVKATGVLRENISIDPRLLTRENAYHDMDKVEDFYFDGKPPKASVVPKTPQQLICQPAAREPQCGQQHTNSSPRDVIMRGENGGLMSRYDQKVSNGAINYNIAGNTGFTGYYNGAPIGVAYNSNVAGNNSAVDHNGNSAYYNGPSYGVASMPQQPQQHQHGVWNFVQVINDEEHRRNAAANITQQQHQQRGEQMAWVKGARIGATCSASSNDFLPAGNYQTAVLDQPAFFGQYGQDDPQQVVQQQPLMHGSGGMFSAPLEDDMTSYDPFVNSPPQQRAYFAQYNSPKQMRPSYNAFATFDQDQGAQTIEARHPFSPYRGPMEYDDIPLSPLTFPVQIPEHTFKAQSAFQQIYAQNRQPYYGGGAGPLQYVPGTGFLYGEKVTGIPEPVYQRNHGGVGFLHHYPKNLAIRERFERIMGAQYGLIPTPQQMMPQAFSMPISMPPSMSRPTLFSKPPPMPMPIGFQQQQQMYGGPGQMPMPMPPSKPMPMGFQQQHMYGGTGQMPAHDQLNINISTGGRTEGSPIHVPYPSQLVKNDNAGGNSSGQPMFEESRVKKNFSFNPESPKFSPRHMPMYNGSSEQPQKYTRQEVIVSRDSGDTFSAKQHRHRLSFESLLYNEYVAAEIFEKEGFNQSQVVVDIFPKSVADSCPNPASPRSSYDLQKGIKINGHTLSKGEKATALAKLNQAIQRTSSGRAPKAVVAAADHDWSFLKDVEEEEAAIVAVNQIAAARDARIHQVFEASFVVVAGKASSQRWRMPGTMTPR